MSSSNKIQNRLAERFLKTNSIISNKFLKRSTFEKIAAIAAILVVWQLAAMLAGNSLLVASPLVVIKRLAFLCTTIEFWSAVLFSFVRIVAGFLLALIAGLLLALAAGKFHMAEVMLWPYMAIVKATPVASFIIICLIWLNSQSLSVFIAFLMVLPIIYSNILQGIKSTDHKLLEMADLFGVNWLRRLHYIYFPHIKPFILSACSISIGLSWKAGIAAEVIGIPTGSIGEKLYEAKIYINSGDIFAWTVVIVAISIIFEKLFLYSLKSFFIGRRKAKNEY